MRNQGATPHLFFVQAQPLLRTGKFLAHHFMLQEH